MELEFKPTQESVSQICALQNMLKYNLLSTFCPPWTEKKKKKIELILKEPLPNKKGQRSGYVLSPSFSDFSKMIKMCFFQQKNRNQTWSFFL